MAKRRVLFVCIHNSARSQMAQAFLKHLASPAFEVESAGLLPSEGINPLAVSVMREADIDISGNRTNDVFEFYKQGKMFNYVITVCDEAAAQRCPVFPGINKILHWSFEDPSAFSGTDQEKIEKTRKVREQIHKKIEDWINEVLKSDTQAPCQFSFRAPKISQNPLIFNTKKFIFSLYKFFCFCYNSFVSIIVFFCIFSCPHISEGNTNVNEALPSQPSVRPQRAAGWRIRVQRENQKK